MDHGQQPLLHTDWDFFSVITPQEGRPILVYYEIDGTGFMAKDLVYIGGKLHSLEFMTEMTPSKTMIWSYWPKLPESPEIIPFDEWQKYYDDAT